ncbi:MAG: LemA family protein [Phycisphaerales bacterium]
MDTGIVGGAAAGLSLGQLAAGMGLVVVIGLVVVAASLILWLIAMYNGLVRRRIDVDNAYSQVDVQLKRRHDLIPNLVETVKGYAGHERGTLEAVISARTRAVQAGSGSIGERAEAEGFLTQALGRLFAVAEAYPQLKANTNFASLQEELASTENRIGFSRQHYNDTVAKYEESRQSFPANIVAGAFNFDGREYFRLEQSAEREVPKVSFS